MCLLFGNWQLLCKPVSYFVTVRQGSHIFTLYVVKTQPAQRWLYTRGNLCRPGEVPSANFIWYSKIYLLTLPPALLSPRWQYWLYILLKPHKAWTFVVMVVIQSCFIYSCLSPRGLESSPTTWRARFKMLGPCYMAHLLCFSVHWAQNCEE